MASARTSRRQSSGSKKSASASNRSRSTCWKVNSFRSDRDGRSVDIPVRFKRARKRTGMPALQPLAWKTSSLFLRQFADGVFHFGKMDVRVWIIRYVLDGSVGADEETDAAGHVFSGLPPGTVGIRDSAVRVHEQGEVEIVLRDETLVALGGIKAHANDLDVVFLQVAHSITQSAGLLGATLGVILGIKIEQHRLFPDFIGEFPGFAVLVLALDERGFVAHGWNFVALSQAEDVAREQHRCRQRK